MNKMPGDFTCNTRHFCPIFPKVIQITSGWAIILLLILGIHSCGLPPQSVEPVIKQSPEAILASLTLREKIAQMMIYHMNMDFLNANSDKWQEIQSLIESDGIGGIHLYYGNPGISMTMLNDIQQRSKIPILFDGDIEYGMQFRFGSGTDLPPLMAIAATGEPALAYEAAKITAIEATSVGIRWNFGPVIDVNNNPENPIINTRAFGESPETVIEFAIPYIQGLKDYGMLSTAKHFPGHGDTQTDSHTNSAEIPSDSVRLWTVELNPYRAAIKAGVDAVMVSHLHAPEFQPQANEPATLSPFWIQDVLRKQLEFDGVVVTDAMGMGAISKNFTDAYALVKAIKAGADVIIQSNHFREAVDVVEKAVQDGKIPESRINEATLRMLYLKQKAGLFIDPFVHVDAVRQKFGTPEWKKTAEEIAARAVTLVKDDRKLIPVPVSVQDTITVIDIHGRDHDHDVSLATRTLGKYELPIRIYAVDETDPKATLDGLVTEIPQNGLVLINTFSAPRAWRDRISLSPRQTEFIHRIQDVTPNIILVSFGNPYLLMDFPDISTYICGYKERSVMQKAVAEALIGKNGISGRLPVSIPGLAPIGTGIERQAIKIILPEKPQTAIRLRRALPEEVSAHPSHVFSLMDSARADSAWPGGVLLAAKEGEIFIHDGFGYHTYARKRAMQRSDIFDLASITKVIASTSAIMKLTEEGQVHLDDPVVKYVPEFRGKFADQQETKSTITIRQLLTHTAGLPPFKQYFLMDAPASVRLDSVLNTRLDTLPGVKTVYSDIGFITLGVLVERVSGLPLDEFVHRHVFKPLGMTDTFFNPPKKKLPRIVPTEYDSLRSRFLHGEVHDENSRSLGGVAGHAGLFSTARDLAIFSQMMLNGGRYNDQQIFKPETIALFTRRANVDEGSSRCLGWATPAGLASGGVYLPDSAYGHTGYTGTSLWIDPENQMFIILLTNAVHPDRSYKYPNYFDWRQRIHSAVYESLGITQNNPHLKWRERWVKTKP